MSSTAISAKSGSTPSRVHPGRVLGPTGAPVPEGAVRAASGVTARRVGRRIRSGPVLAGGSVSSVSALDTAARAFAALTTEPAPLCLDLRLVGHGLPRRTVRLDRLARLLTHPSVPVDARDAAWRVLVAKARHDGPAWVIGAVGVAMPGLRRAVGRLSNSSRVDAADLAGEVLAGFLDALRHIDVEDARVCPRLLWRGYAFGRRAAHADLLESRRHVAAVEASAPPPPFGHPDLVLARAVQDRAITAAEANLIGETRLENVSLLEVAQRLGIAKSTLAMRRRRAEHRLQRYLAENNRIHDHTHNIADDSAPLRPVPRLVSAASADSDRGEHDCELVPDFRAAS